MTFIAYHAPKHRNETEEKVTVSHFYWDGLRLAGESRADRPENRRWYAYNEGSYEPIAFIDYWDIVKRDEIYYYHTNINGAPEELTAEDGQYAWKGHFTLWGKSYRVEQPISTLYDQPLRFQGQYFDQETGLHYNTFRYYDPETGSFTQQDPIGVAGGINLYQYAPNPLMWVDPFGWKCWSTARKDFWKNEAKVNPDKYSPRNLARMRNGQAPKIKIQVRNNTTGALQIKNVSIELHHKYLPQRGGSSKAHETWNQ